MLYITYMKFDFNIRWLLDSPEREEFDPRLLHMLKEIKDKGSLRQAADICGLSYRFAWGLFRLWNGRFGGPLVDFKRGRGAKLTELGEKMLWVEQVLNTRLQTELNSLSVELNHELAMAMQAQRPHAPIRIHASHDLAISYLQELCEQSREFAIDFQIKGSLEALSQVHQGHCEIAGFHFPRGNLSGLLREQYEPWLDTAKVQLLQIAVRQQGLMTHSDNPLNINSLKDLERGPLRFINRQKNSGTRIIFDSLLAHEGIESGRIDGYFEEEFTHLAVAAMLASGAADAGFGIKAAAIKFGLHFIPIVEESYVLAVSRELPLKHVEELKNILIGERFKKKIQSLPGYLAMNTGKVLNIDKLLLGK